ncbi:MAG TPA: alpha/beta fold hydrolase [Pyrinomonadaceae bacterium]|jgi:medium-chain acyl-[acyl-carrier-protein] hydrolase
MTERTASNPWLTWPKPNPQARLRLFCFPYAGGSNLIYRNWHEGLPADVELCPVQLPGRGNRLREPAFTSLPPLVVAAAAALRPYLDKPFAFFGHSMGASIGFELARYLRRHAGLEPAYLFVSGRCAPRAVNPERQTYNLPEPEFIEELRRLQGTPAEVLAHPEMMQLLLPLLRADFELIQTYVYEPEPPLACPLAVFGGLQDDDTSRACLEPWREQTSATFSLQIFPGDHFFLNTARPLLLQSITRKLYQHQLASIPT